MRSPRDVACTLFTYGFGFFTFALVNLAKFVLPLGPLRRFTGCVTSLPLLWNPFVSITPIVRGSYAGLRSVIVLATHKSSVDSFVLVGVARTVLDVGHMRVLYKADLHNVPLLGGLLRALKWIPVTFRSMAIEDVRGLELDLGRGRGRGGPTVGRPSADARPDPRARPSTRPSRSDPRRHPRAHLARRRGRRWTWRPARRRSSRRSARRRSRAEAL